MQTVENIFLNIVISLSKLDAILVIYYFIDHAMLLQVFKNILTIICRRSKLFHNILFNF